MPLLHRLLIELDASSYSNTPGVGGSGPPVDVAKKILKNAARQRGGLRVLENQVVQGIRNAPAQGSLGHQFEAVEQIQSLERMLARRQAIGPLERQTQSRFLRSDVVTSIESQVRSQQPAVVMASTSHLSAQQLSQQARTAFSSVQVMELSKMVTEWLTVVEKLLDCAVTAESQLTGALKEDEKLRKARVKFVGKLIGGIIKLAAPPPFGQIVGGVVEAVLTGEAWTDVAKSSATSAISATYKTNQHKWTYDKDTKTWKDAVGETDTALIEKQTQAYINPGVGLLLSDAPTILGKSAAEKFKKINERTLVNAIAKRGNIPEQSQLVGQIKPIIRQQVAEKIDAVFAGVTDTFVEYTTQISAAESLLWACWEFQKEDLLAYAARMESSLDRRQDFVQRTLLTDAVSVLHTTAHMTMVDLARVVKAKVTVLNIDETLVSQAFERYFWAMYFSDPGSGLDIKKKKQTRTDRSDESYYLDNYGAAKEDFWKGSVRDRLVTLRVIRQFESTGWVFKSRDPTYKPAINQWSPPDPQNPKRAWPPVPYRQGGPRSAGRLAAWATEYAKLPPEDLFEVVFGS